VPLTDAVFFKAVLERRGRFQVPRIVRWQFKLESSQALLVNVRPVGSFVSEEEFFANMRKDGRITIPKVTLDLLARSLEEGESLAGAILKVRLKPT
jgi:bifunctional DNA-binding transcriptional regulator/antitoxin component of YhaV-PrlF toxin-antitoxin module